MSADAWIFQRTDQLQKLGPDAASWYVGWYEPNGRRKAESCGPGKLGRAKAEARQRRINSQLMEGTYRSHSRKPWAEFLAEYDERVLSRLAPRSRPQANTSLNHFTRIVKPRLVFGIGTADVDRFVAARRLEPGDKRGSRVSPATVNHDLRHLKAALRVACEWKYLPELPKIRMEKVPVKLATYVTGEDFAAIYGACTSARMPKGIPNVSPADWWRGLLVTGYMTGWRLGDMLGLRRADLDLEAGTAITRAADNKGKRDERVKLHPVVVEHLRKLAGFTPAVFPWNHNPRTLHTEFARIQEAAGIHLPCADEHEHTRYCYLYGFHDLRRAFATMNADKLTPDALQALMRHKSYQTTQVYINMTRQMDAAVAGLHVPDVLRTREAR